MLRFGTAQPRATPWQASAPASRRVPRAPGRPAESGFTLIGLMVLIAVINIGLGVALTSWVTIGKRAKEAELIWRGQQYARALACHRNETGALPDELDELLETDCIRALYPEPMTGSGQWRIVRESELRASGFGGRDSPASMLDSIDRELRGPEAFFDGGGTAGGQFPTGAAGGRFPGDAPGAGRTGPGGAATSESLQTAFERLRNLTERLRQDFATSGDGIVGVASTSTATSLRLYEGESTYDAWRFMAR